MSTNSIYRSPAGEQEVMALYDAIFAHWPVPHEDFNISTRYGNTFVIASGKATDPPLFLLHGASSNALAWMGDAPQLSRFFRVYAVDIPGDPGRSAPSRPSWNSPAYADWLEDIFNGLNISRAILIGLSQGGWLAIKFAVAHPERVTKIVTLSPAGVTNDKLSFLLSAIWYSGQGKRGAEALNRLTFGNQPIPEEVLRVMQVIMTHFRPRIGKLNLFTDAELRKLTMPALLVGGHQDAIRNVEKIAARMQRLLPDLSVKIYPDKGHVLANISGDLLPFLTANSTHSH